MKKLIITSLLLTNIICFSYAQEPATPAPTPPPVAPTAPPAAPPAPVPVTYTTTPTPEAKEDRGMMFGLKVTPTYCWFTLERDGYKSDGGIIGFTYGFMTDFRLSDNYYLATGIDISQRGGKYKSDSLSLGNGIYAKGTVKQRLNFLDIPFSMKLKTKEIGYMKYYGSFGVLTGFTVKANQDIDFEDNSIEDRTKRNNMSDFGIFNFGLLLGVGLEYNIAGNTAITLGLQYHNSFVDVWSLKNEAAKINPNYVSLNLGVFF